MLISSKCNKERIAVLTCTLRSSEFSKIKGKGSSFKLVSKGTVILSSTKEMEVASSFDPFPRFLRLKVLRTLATVVLAVPDPWMFAQLFAKNMSFDTSSSSFLFSSSLSLKS